MNKVNGKTKIFGVIADPIEHVKAPSIYNKRWINENKNYLMIPLHVQRENLSKVIMKVTASARRPSRECRNIKQKCI